MHDIDYIIPLSKGGVNKIWNTVPVLPGIKAKRGDQDLIPWLKSQGLYSKEKVQRIIDWQKYAYSKYATEEDAPLVLLEDE